MSHHLDDFEILPEKLSPQEEYLVFPQDLVLTETTRKNLRKILFPLYENRNILLVGDAGIGKNAFIYYINKLRNIPTIRFSFNQDTLPEDLIGSYRILPDGFHWNNGPLTEAMTKGYAFVADEMNLASVEILKRFISVFERRKIYLLEKDGSQLSAHPRFSFIATQNPSRGFEGRKILPESIQKYFTIIYMDSYPQEEEARIIHSSFPSIPGGLVLKTVRLGRSLEKALWKNDIARDDLEHYHFNIRTQQMFWNRLAAEKDVTDESVVFIHTLFAFFVDIFRKAEDRLTALEKIAAEFSFNHVGLRKIYDEYHSRAGENFQIWLDQSMIRMSMTGNSGQPEGKAVPAENTDPFPITRKRIGLMERIKESLDFSENLLLEGEDAARIGELVMELARHENQNVRWLFLSKGMHTSDILGALRPSGGKSVEWMDGPFTQGVKKEDWIILDNIEAAGSELIEKLNMFLDHARQMLLPGDAPGEGEDAFLQRKGKTRVIAIKRSRKSRNETTISRAFRNRFFSMQIPTPESDREISESADLVWKALFGRSPEEKEVFLLDKMVQFHGKMADASTEKKIGRTMDFLKFREENIIRWISHIFHWIDRGRELESLTLSGIQSYYLGMLNDPEDRQWAEKLWNFLFHDIPWEDIRESLIRKKKNFNNRSHRIAMDWDQKKHFRDAHTGKAKPRLSGPRLKKGLRIDTPETGGKIKEGPDAWYGQDTAGNKGMGEPIGGGGAWGYRTEEIFQQFLEKYKPKWEYNMGFEIEDFYETFGKVMEQLKMNLDNALDSSIHVDRRLESTGNRVEPRKYIAYLNNRGNDKIFDRSRVYKVEDKLKGLEILFFLNKGRRLFNYNYSIGSIVALQSAAEILWDHKIPIKVLGYSDFDNRKKSIDVVEYTASGAEITLNYKREVFQSLVDSWSGDTVEDHAVVPRMTEHFSPDAVTRIAVFVSDFRGHRALRNMEDEIVHEDQKLMKKYIREFSRQNYIFLGIQTGSRYIAEHLFDHSVWINNENFAKAPVIIMDALEKLIIRYHKPA